MKQALLATAPMVLLLVLASVLLISVVSFVGVATLAIRADRLQKILLYLVSFSAGGLLGDAFLHLLPETVEQQGGLTLGISVAVLLGIVFSFTVEKFVHWHHHGVEHEHDERHVAPFAIMNMLGDFVHNFIDGMIIAGSYLVSVPLGVATTLAVVVHEIPQEIGDFGVLVHGGFSRAKALFVNFLSALGALVGAGIALALGAASEEFLLYLIPFAVGNFVYIAGSDLIPELQKTTHLGRSALQLVFLLAGLGAMAGLLLLEGP